MEKVRPWCGQPSDRGRLKNRTELSWKIAVEYCHWRADVTGIVSILGSGTGSRMGETAVGDISSLASVL